MYICFILLINSSTTPVILTLSLHDALPIFLSGDQLALGAQLVGPVVQCHQQAVRPDPRHAGDSAIADAAVPRDRKSTRLNSSHTVISYAVFCLKKKNQNLQICSSN